MRYAKHISLRCSWSEWERERGSLDPGHADQRRVHGRFSFRCRLSPACNIEERTPTLSSDDLGSVTCSPSPLLVQRSWERECVGRAWSRWPWNALTFTEALTRNGDGQDSGSGRERRKEMERCSARHKERERETEKEKEHPRCTHTLRHRVQCTVCMRNIGAHKFLSITDPSECLLKNSPEDPRDLRFQLIARNAEV